MIRFLLVNDDGINSKGLKAVVDALEGLGEIYIAAPAKQMSAVGHGITMRDNIRVDEVEYKGAKKAWAIYGTPADCVKLATTTLLDNPCDLTISGINEGSNLGSDTLYSGTVAAALEAAFDYTPAMAISLAKEKGPYDFSPCIKYIREIVEGFLKETINIPYGVCLNINIPAIEEIKGIKASKLSMRHYDDYYVKKGELEGSIGLYHIEGEPLDKNIKEDYLDVNVVKSGYISITPIKVDMTDDNMYLALKDSLKKGW